MLRSRLKALLAGGLAFAGLAWAHSQEAGDAVFFREPGLRGYRVADEAVASPRLAAAARPQWLRALPVSGRTNAVWLGSRVVLKLKDPARAAGLALKHGATVLRQAGQGTFLLQAADARAAVEASAALAAEPGVEAAVPVMRRHRVKHSPWTAAPSDSYFDEVWHLDNRDGGGRRAGVDVNARAAWALTCGAGVTIAIVDDGFEVNHPDLKENAAGAPHFDFTTGIAASRVYGNHATAVAGLAAARGANGRGTSGVAGEAHIASWAIFDAIEDIAPDDALADAFTYRMETVGVQNHSWGNSGLELGEPSLLEREAVTRAVTEGRGGLGTVMVRSGGNSRDGAGNVNYDAYPNDPLVIAVAAVRTDGRAASYSSPGACLLVGAPSGDQLDQFSRTVNLYTTDRAGSSAGYNQIGFADDRADYGFGSVGFAGTSGSAPIIAGTVSLALAVNPALTVRDVQQVLLHSAHHWNGKDPSRATNSAGYLVSHNVGFGVPDAWQVVDLARRWSNRPALTELSYSSTVERAIPDDGLRVLVSTGGGPPQRLRCQPALGTHAEATTEALPLAYIGRAPVRPAQDLRGRVALIERGDNFFWEKIENAAAAGAEAAIIFNNRDGNALLVPGGTDWTPIPAVLISENDGRALLARLTNGVPVTAQLEVTAAGVPLEVTDTLALEHVGVRVRTTHTRRGDLRIVLTSPAGTRSVLQTLGNDFEAGPEDWTYWSTQHFYEGSAGPWTVHFLDEDQGFTGAVLEVELRLRGVAIEDADRDGLDDAWERRWLGGLARGPRDDPDGDGSWNAREQVVGTDPTQADRPFGLEIARHDATRWRLTWPAREGETNRVHGGGTVGSLGGLETVTGRFPETEAIMPANGAQGFFQVAR
ncbi:MAG: S8 family serine peptidase [Limisphaerales bacterium]